MYVVWKRRELRGTHPCECCNDSSGRGRVAFIPSIVRNQRVDGIPRQVHVARLASIRNCCLQNERILAGWWRRVETAISTLSPPEAEAIRRLLRDGLTRMKHRTDRKQQQQQEKTTRQTNYPSYLAHAIKLLGLGWPCRTDEIKTAFRRRAKQTHPDLGGRAEDFRAVSEAYSTLLRAVGGSAR